MLTLGNRYWKRENLQVKDWVTGTMDELFVNEKIKAKEVEKEEKKTGEKPVEEDKTAESVKTDKTKVEGQEKPIEKTAENKATEGNKKEVKETKDKDVVNPKTAADKGEIKEEKPEEIPPHFPTEKWDVHLYKPTGEEIIISGNEYWLKPNVPEAEWEYGLLTELFKDNLVESDKKGDQIPLGATEKVDKEKEQEDAQFLHLANRLMEELRTFFRPELLNRFDEVVVFRPLAREHMLKIVDLNIKSLGKLLTEQNIAITVSDLAKAYLCEVGFDPVYGARPLRRTMQRLIENSISSLLIKGDLADGDTVVVDMDKDNEQLVFNIQKMQRIEIKPEGQASPPQDPNAVPQNGETKTKEEGVLTYACDMCGHNWQVKPEEVPNPLVCPQCASTLVHEIKEEKPAVANQEGQVVSGVTDQTGKEAEQNANPSTADEKNTAEPKVVTAPKDETENTMPDNPLSAFFTSTTGEEPLPPPVSPNNSGTAMEPDKTAVSV
jgi:hypothetical protein